MSKIIRLILCGFVATALSQCSSGEDESSESTGLSLQQRSTRKPDTNHRSQFEKYIGGSGKDGLGTASWYQKQAHHSKSFNGGNTYAGQKQFNTKSSWFGRSKSQSADRTYALGDKASSAGKNAFKTSPSNFGSIQARESGTVFSPGGNAFKSGSALTRSERTPRMPTIIDNVGTSSAKSGAYSEDEVKRLLGR